MAKPSGIGSLLKGKDDSTDMHSCVVLALCPTSQNSALNGNGCTNVGFSTSQENVQLEGQLRTHALAGVVASPSGPVIPGVAIEIVDSKKRCLKATTTDVNGRFDFKISKPGRILFTVVAINGRSPNDPYRPGGNVEVDLEVLGF